MDKMTDGIVIRYRKDIYVLSLLKALYSQSMIVRKDLSWEGAFVANTLIHLWYNLNNL